MEDELLFVQEWLATGEKVALAVLVRTIGSSPRLPGAKLWITESGVMRGSVSGGCVENDIYQRAIQVLSTGDPELVSYEIADEMGFEIGLSCGGSIDVLIQPFVWSDLWDAFSLAICCQEAAVIATALEPASTMSRRLLRTTAQTFGAIDPAVDEEVARRCRELLESEGTRIITYPSGHRVFFEAYAPPPHLFIIGATHVGMPLVAMAKRLGFRSTVIDARSLFATKDRFPGAEDVIRAQPEKILPKLYLDRRSYVVVLTHDPKFDIPTLALALNSHARYIGAMGSTRTHQKRIEALREMGFTVDQLNRIHAPIGLEIGARTPDEVALAILAEMTRARNS